MVSGGGPTTLAATQVDSKTTTARPASAGTRGQGRRGGGRVRTASASSAPRIWVRRRQTPREELGSGARGGGPSSPRRLGSRGGGAARARQDLATRQREAAGGRRIRPGRITERWEGAEARSSPDLAGRTTSSAVGHLAGGAWWRRARPETGERRRVRLEAGREAARGSGGAGGGGSRGQRGERRRALPAARKRRRARSGKGRGRGEEKERKK
ncbi:hypothetical protein PAHAL_3G168100 [Panicum hallii]|uniref:Uncharacterized protein n=1 Tax=Panicum hallii TaxID=206008 RepID=A0A2T8KIH1_9POAL|nr:hypothetical protein PAHAL_3G168100 [Panicum hallii]